MPAHALRASVLSNDTNGNPQFLSMWGTNTDPQKIICNGPYQIESYTPAERVILRRNPYYWRKDVQRHPQPYIQRIVWQIISSTENQLVRFRSGEVDTLNVTPASLKLMNASASVFNVCCATCEYSSLEFSFSFPNEQSLA